jgi:uncharacterized protein (TIGR02145 family)
MNRLQTILFLLLCAVAVQAQSVDKVNTECVQIAGTCWATRNVAKPGKFAAKPEDAGKLYQWNRKKAWSSKGRVRGWDSSYPTGSEWEKANDPCPAGFRVSNRTEQEALVNAGSTWTTNYNGTGVAGRVFGSGEKVVFFPAAGCRGGIDGRLGNVGGYGYYWSSVGSSDSSYAYYLGVNGNTAYMYDSYRILGRSVRCVAE